jgi:MATE family multidrug resistance protein
MTKSAILGLLITNQDLNMLIYREPLLRKQILTIAGPAMGEMIMYMIIGVVDIAVVGRLGASPLAAVSLGAEIFFSLVLFLEALAIGANVLVAQAKGAGNYHQIRSYIAHTIVIAVVLGFVLQAGGLYYTQDILGLFAVEPSVSQQAYDYLYITFQIAPFALLMYMTNAIFRGLGRTDISLIIAVIVNIVNVVGDILLVFGLAGFPKMGVAGAAAATAAAHVVGCGLALAALLFGFSGVRPGWQNFIQLKLRYFKDILTLGIPSLIEQFFYLTSNLLSIYLLVFLGTISFAVHQLAVTVESVSYMPGFGIAIAATTLVGQSIGAQDSKSAAKFAQGCIELSLVIMGSFALIFALAPSWIAGMFTNDPDIIPLAEIIIRIAALEQLTIAFTTVASGILKGSGNTRTPMLISTVFTWFFRLPLMYIMIKIFAVPLLYLWILFIFDWFLRSLVYLRLYKRKNWLRPALVKGDSTAD